MEDKLRAIQLSQKCKVKKLEKIFSEVWRRVTDLAKFGEANGVRVRELTDYTTAQPVIPANQEATRAQLSIIRARERVAALNLPARENFIQASGLADRLAPITTSARAMTGNCLPFWQTFHRFYQER